MAEKESSGSSGGFNVPFTALLALMTVVGGAAFYLMPLSSDRPPSPGTDARVGTLGYQDVDARIWQDPLQAAFTARENAMGRNTREPGASDYEISPATGHPSESVPELHASLHVVPVTRPAYQGPSHKLGDLHEQIRRVLAKSGPATAGTTQAVRDSPDILVLGVFVPSGLYGELVEQRLRARIAVLEGLGICGYQPQDDNHIGYFQMPWPWPANNDSGELWEQWNRQREREKGAETSPKLVVPYEWCAPKPPLMAGTMPCFAKYQGVILLWLSQDEFSDVPLTRIAFLIQSIGGSTPRTALDYKFIGPYDSTSLHAMVGEVAHGICQDVKTVLGNVHVYAATPTASDEMLLSNDDRTRAEYSTLTLDQFIDKGVGSSFLIRTTLTDKSLCRDLVDELELRGLKIRALPGDPPDKAFRHAGDLDHVAIIAEWDTFYGRALPLSFTAALFENKTNIPSAAPNVQNEIRKQTGFPDWVHPFVYLRGIDGNAPAPGRPADMSDKSGEPASGEGKGPMASGRDAADKPEGTNQTDYLRRLADQLANTDERLRRMTGKGIMAVGVLGTDVYDTLLILRAVRQRLGNALYFTTNLDARFSMRSEWQATHNLIVVSPFGLALHPYYQDNVPPFRDSNQTASFAAVLTAMGRIQNPIDIVCGRERRDTDPIPLPSRRFEIGRRGPWELTVDYVKPDRLKPSFLVPGLSKPGPGPDPAVDTELAAPGGRDVPVPLTIHPSRWDLVPWLYGWREFIIWAAVLLLPVGAWLCYIGPRSPAAMEPSDQRDKGGATRLSEAWAQSLPWVMSLVALALAMVLGSMFAGLGGQSGEPMTLIAGISTWPAEALRLTAIALSVCFIIRARADLVRNDERIEKEFLCNTQKVKKELLP